MTLQNRVLPTGEITTLPFRGSLTGNRGILHGPDRVLARASQHIHWIACTLHWQGRRREPMTGRKWTELFFWDEAVALAAGHRPCAYCRRADFRAWRAAWADAFGACPPAAVMDRLLQASRRDGRAQRTHRADAATLPDGAFVAGPALVWQGALHPWSPDGYDGPRPMIPGEATVLTPAVTVAVLRAGYPVSARLQELGH